MEITNCEQYVIAELDYEQRRNERLVAENNKLAKQLDAMTKRAKSYKETIDRPKTPIEAYADKAMRESLMNKFFLARVTNVRNPGTGTQVGFESWCADAFCEWQRPDGISRNEIIEFLRADLKKEYEELVAECTE